MSRRVTGWKGPEEVTQEWTEINDSGRRQKAMGRVGWVGGITLCQLTICTMDSCPTEARMTWVSGLRKLSSSGREKCHRADMNSPTQGLWGRGSAEMLPIVRPGAQTPGPDLSSVDRKRNTELRLSPVTPGKSLCCFLAQCRQLPRPLLLPLSSFLLPCFPVFDHRVPSTRVSFLI